MRDGLLVVVSPLLFKGCGVWCRCASTAEIKRAYKKLALAYHPDKHKTHDEEQQVRGEEEKGHCRAGHVGWSGRGKWRGGAK